MKNQEAFAIYDATSGWVGGLQTIENGQAYFVKLQQSNRLLQDGTPTDPASPIALNTGWTWIGYLPTTALPVDEALTALSATEGDVIKSQYGFAEYVGGNGWIGSLSLLEPGLGYVIYSDAGGTLVYPTGSPLTRTETESALAVSETSQANALSNTTASTSVNARVREESNANDELKAMKSVAIGESNVVNSELGQRDSDSRPESDTAEKANVIQPWAVDAEDYAETMTVTAEILRDGVVLTDPNLQVGLFVGDELRGLGRIQFVESQDKHLAFIMGYGNDASAEPFNIRLMNVATGETEDVENATVGFKANARMGSVAAPIVLESTTFELPTEFELAQNYPNPFNPETVIRFALPVESAVQIEVFDVLGRRVAVLMDSDKVEAGSHSVSFDASALASGMYVYRMKAGEFKSVHKMTLLK